MMRAACIACAICASLCACTPSVGVRPSAPLQIVHTHYIPIPASLLQPCTGAPALSPTATWGDLAQAYIGLRASYASCAAQIDAIRNTEQPTCTVPLQCSIK